MIQLGKYISNHEGKISLSAKSAFVKKIAASPISKDTSDSIPTKGFFRTITISYDNDEIIKLKLYAETEGELDIKMKNDFKDLKKEMRNSDTVLKVITKEDEADNVLEVSFFSETPDDLYVSPTLVAVKNISVYPINDNYGDFERWIMVEFENGNCVEYILMAKNNEALDVHNEHTINSPALA